jgi:hypothetical protein
MRTPAHRRSRTLLVIVALAASYVPLAVLNPSVAVPNPVATDEPSYQALGRVFSDPHGCMAVGVPDADGDGIKDTPQGVSPWAKGRACADQFLQYQEVIDGSKFLQSRFPEFVRVIRLDQAYDNSNYRSAGIPRMAAFEDGKFELLGRDRRPLYLLKVTDSTSPVPESERQHFAYSLSIHGIERAGVEGGVRAMEDLVTWAACEVPKYAQTTPACASEGPFPKRIIETPTEYPVPSAGQVLDNSVVYFILANPDGWARGQVAPTEIEDGGVNANYTPGFFFQRYNGNGVDLNRDWPTVGYTFKPYSPGSEPETKAFGEVLRGIRKTTKEGRFSGGIDLHGMFTAYAFSYTLLGASQRDFERNELTVETAVRTWEDQTRRLNWSNYVADRNGNGVNDGGETCVNDQGFVVFGTGTRPRTPACVADQWGTVIDTIGYQITGGIGDWIESPIGLDAIGIDNEMYASHLVPNTVFEPALEQSHIDGNKGLIYSQIAALLSAEDISYEPTGKIGYVFNPTRLQVDGSTRPSNPGLPAQNDVNTIVPCQSAGPQNLDGACGPGAWDAPGFAYEFEVQGPGEGIWNGGFTVTTTKPNALGVSDGNLMGIQVQHYDEGQWHVAASDYNQSFLYLQAGAIITVNDPEPGRWRVAFSPASAFPLRLKIDFHPATAESSPGQAEIDASSMDFFEELNGYIPDGSDAEAVTVQQVIGSPKRLAEYDSVIVVNDLGSRQFLSETLGLAPGQINVYFDKLKRFAESGGNLVLTDAALQALPELGVVPAASVRRSTSLVGNYNFQIQNGLVTYGDPDRFPLSAGVNKPGAAEQQNGRRQAVEPTPLGYTPDTGSSMDGTPQMPWWGVDRPAWTAACGLDDCVTATTVQNGNQVNLGEARIGDGRVRIAGILFPDPIFQPDARNDHRFGLSDYALTYTGWEVFKNLVDFARG